MRKLVYVVPVVTWLSIFIMSCSWFTPAKVADIGKIVECVLMHEQEPIGQIAETCAIQNTQEIIDIISAHHIANARSIQKICNPVDKDAGE